MTSPTVPGSPSKLAKPYTTGARPSTTAAKANVHMTGGGWVRTITATDYAWAGNDNVASSQEVLVAFRGSAEQGWYAYSYWVNASAISNTTRVAIDIHVHFQEQVDVTGSPTITITNDKLGSGGGGSVTTVVCTYVSGTGGHRILFRSAVPALNALRAGDVLHIGANAIALAGGTIKDAGTNTATLITGVSDLGYRGTENKGGGQAITSTGTTPVVKLDGPRVLVG